MTTQVSALLCLLPVHDVTKPPQRELSDRPVRL